jgi:two-component system sensor histidine kinase MtrB
VRRRRDRLRVRIAGLLVVAVLLVWAALTIVALSVPNYETGKLDRAVVLIGLISLILAIALGVAAAAAITGPIRRTTAAARRFGSGELDVRLPAHGKTELAELGTAFNSMAAQLSDTLRDLHESQTLQQRFVADVSHELRTPLAAMLAADEGIDSRDEQARQRSIELVRGQTRRLVKLVDDLLEMSRFDAGQTSIEYETVDLAALAADVVHTIVPEENVRITSLGDTSAEADVRRIHTVLRNLVANAFQHGQPPVDVIVDGRQPDTVTVTVADDGPGVPPDIAPSIFDRFVRADEARTSQGAHSGLGLAIAHENAMLHGATLALSITGRTAFTLNLPRVGRRKRGHGEE